LCCCFKGFKEGVSILYTRTCTTHIKTIIIKLVKNCRVRLFFASFRSRVFFLGTNTGNTMDRKEKAQTQTIQWKKKKKHKHKSYNEQKRQRTSTDNTMDIKNKGQTEAIQCTKKTNDKHRR
jgi:hypothetical protein